MPGSNGRFWPFPRTNPSGNLAARQILPGTIGRRTGLFHMKLECNRLEHARNLGAPLACCGSTMRISVQPSSTPVTSATLPLQASRSWLSTIHAAKPRLNAAAIPASGEFQKVFDQAAAADSSLGKDSSVSGSKTSPSDHGSVDIPTPRGSTYNPVMEQTLTQLAAEPGSQDPVLGTPGKPALDQRPTAPCNKPSSAALPDGKAAAQLTDLTQSTALLVPPAGISTHGKPLRDITPSTLNSTLPTATSTVAIADIQTAAAGPPAGHNLKFPTSRRRDAEGTASLEADAVARTSEQPIVLNVNSVVVTTAASTIPNGFSLSETIALAPASDGSSQLENFTGRSHQARQVMNKLNSNALQSAEDVASLVDGSSSKDTNQFAPAHVKASSTPLHPHATHSTDLRQIDLQSTKADTVAVSGLPGVGYSAERTRPSALLSPTSTDPSPGENIVLQASPTALPAGGSALAVNFVDPVKASLSTDPTQSATPQITPALITLATRTDGSNEMIVSLHPLDLGKVEVRLTRGRDGSTAVTISATELKTLQELSQNVHHLHAALDAANVPADGRIINFMVTTNTASDQSQSDLPDHNGAPVMDVGSNASGGQGGNQSQSWQQNQRGQATHGVRDEDTPHSQAASAISIHNWQFSGLNITA